MDEKVQEGAYVPYSALTLKVRKDAAQGDEGFVANIDSGFIAKGLDCSNEKSILFIEWLASASSMEGLVCHYHGDDRTDALAAHHRNVTELVRLHGWPLCQAHNSKGCGVLAEAMEWSNGDGGST